MADNVEVVLAAYDLRAIDLGHEDGFIIRVRAGEKVAERIDDAAAAARDDRVRVVTVDRPVIGGEVAAPVELIARQHETTALYGDVAHRCQPHVARIRGR